MTDLLAACGQMAVSLAFHILFAVAGMAMPLLMVIAESLHLRTGDPLYKDLAKRWARGTAILFAVGAVSGTVLSFELGLLWPTFMEHAGPVIGMPFSIEGFFFFLEAIFLGIFLYGWDRVSPRLHLFSGVMVAVSGLMSGVVVVSVNAWMNSPAGFKVVEGQFVDVDVMAAIFNPAFPTQALHMAVAAYTSVAFAVMGIHAWRLLRDPSSRFHGVALKIALGVAIVSVVLQLASGDLAAKHLAEYQPSKLAAAEGHFKTTRGASLSLVGWPDEDKGELIGEIGVPYALSILGKADPNAEIEGLDKTPRADWPPVAVVYVAFKVMVGAGFAMFGVALWGAWLWWRRRPFGDQTRFLKALILASPLGMIALEAGWVVTEVGRQPWIIRGVMRTADAVTPMPGLAVPFVAFTALYAFLGVVVIALLKAHVFAVPVTPAAPTARPVATEA